MRSPDSMTRLMALDFMAHLMTHSANNVRSTPLIAERSFRCSPCLAVKATGIAKFSEEKRTSSYLGVPVF